MKNIETTVITGDTKGMIERICMVDMQLHFMKNGDRETADKIGKYMNMEK